MIGVRKVSLVIIANIDTVAPNDSPPLPDGFRLGKFSDIELYEWLTGPSRFGLSDPGNTRVTSAGGPRMSG